MSTMEKRSRGRPRLQDGTNHVAGVQSLERAIAVLGIVADNDGLSLTEISETSGLAASTVYRMLTTFQAHNMVEFDEMRQLWSMGVETFRMGSSFLRRRKLSERGREVMRHIQIESGETANFAVSDETGVVFVSQVETHQPIRAFFRPGSRGDFHSSGIGKAILAFRDEAEVRALVERCGLTRYTPKTRDTVDALMADLAEVRRRGWAVDDEERHDGMRCIAAPVFNEYGEPMAGVSLSGPAVRVTAARDAEFGALVNGAAREMTEMIGGQWKGD